MGYVTYWKKEYKHMKIYFQEIPNELRAGFELGPNDDGIAITVKDDSNPLDTEIIEGYFEQFENLEHYATNLSDEDHYMQVVYRVTDVGRTAEAQVPNGWDKIEADDKELVKLLDVQEINEMFDAEIAEAQGQPGALDEADTNEPDTEAKYNQGFLEALEYMKRKLNEKGGWHA